MSTRLARAVFVMIKEPYLSKAWLDSCLTVEIPPGGQLRYQRVFLQNKEIRC